MANRNTNQCCVGGCINKQRDSTLSFFQLPAYPERRNEWLKKIGRPDLLSKTNIKKNSYKVCSVHFDSSMISELTTRKLLPNAIPTKFLPINEPVTAKERQGFLTIEPLRIKRRRESEPDEKETEASSLSVNPPGNQDEEFIRRFLKLIQWQKSLRDKYKDNFYDPQFKFFALKLYFSSPQCYRSLNSVLKLPSESALSRFKLNIQPDLDDRIFNTISTKLQYLPEAAKYCTLCIGEMTLRRFLYYNIKKDEIIGLQNCNGNVTNEIASNAYVVMLRGILINWKQPIGYAFLASTEHYFELDEWINEAISKLYAFGIKVMAVVSNQDSSFDKYAKRIKKVTAEKPFFTFNENKIYYIFDVPHLFNCIRNDLMSSDFYYDENIISWNHVKKMYSFQKEHKLALMPKITDAHIEPNNFQKLQVKYAAQVFSRAMFGALNTFIHAKLIPARATADFVKCMNDLFDVLNSSTVKRSNDNQKAFTLSECQIAVLDTAQNTFRKLIDRNQQVGTSNTNQIKTFINFEITIQAIKMLSRDLKDNGFKFIFTRRLNKEPLDCFFYTIRKQIGNREPTPIQFKKTFSKLFLCNLLKNSPSSNCEKDLFQFLLKGNTMLFKDSIENISKLPDTLLLVSLNGETDYRFDPPMENAVTYVSWYLLFKCLQRHECSTLAEFLNSYNINDSSMRTSFEAVNNNFCFNEDLKVPPETFTNCVKELEATFLKNFDKVMIKKPANTLLSLMKIVRFNVPCTCFPAWYLLKLFVRFRIYSTLKFNNKFLRKNKKCINPYIKVKQLL